MGAERGDRERYILDVLSRRGSLSVSTLAKDLSLSEVTVRSTLRDLESRGLLSRTWGGARPVSIQSVLERSPQHSAAKERIAQTAAELVVDFDTVFIEAGTTTAQVVRALANRAGVQIVTNSTLVFAYARALGNLEVILTGGSFHRESESLVGPLAVRGIGGFNSRLAFVGTDGFSLERGMTTQFAEGADVIRAMHAQTQETWLLADSSKLGQTGFVNVLPLGDLAGVITDSDIDPAALAALTQYPLRVLTPT